MKHIVALLASIFAVTVLQAARAQTDGNATAYLPSCAAALDLVQGRKPAADSPEAAAQLRRAAMCFNAVNAVLNMQPYLQREYSACAPGNAQITAAQALPVVIAYLGAHRDQLGEKFHPLALAALAEKWPCR